MDDTRLPDDEKALVKKALEIIERCRASAGRRANQCRVLHQLLETGKSDGERSQINLLYSHVDRLASHLFSPTDLRFTCDFDYEYDEETLKRGSVAARVINRIWKKGAQATDMTFAKGVFASLKYGAAVMKQWPEQVGETRETNYRSTIVMPWQFGVWREDQADLDLQPALCETFVLTLPEVWRRIWHLPNARVLMERIVKSARRGDDESSYNSFSHEVMSTSTLNTSGISPSRPAPGGVAQLNMNPDYSTVAPDITAEMVQMHELWVQDGDDYTTVQIIAPDILIAPKFKRSNLLISGSEPSGLHPYTLIQANEAEHLWGRSELADLIEPQQWLSTSANDARRLLGLQVDKFLGFIGDGIPEEKYGAMKDAGFLTMSGPNDKIVDLTPKFPPELLPLMEFQIRMIENIGGFDNMLSGRGESGVRSGIQNNTMLKTASPRLRDRALLVERQCADAADLTLSLAQAKDGRNHWTDSRQPEKTSFLLADLPEDRRIVVDSHTSSPIFSDDHAQLVAFGVKAGFVDGDSAIDMLNFPNKDLLKRRADIAAEKKEKMLADLQQRDPETWAKIVTHSGHR